MEASGNIIEGSKPPQDLPLDIINDILTRLSTETLVKFKFVCKTWSCLISSSQFKKTNLNLSKNSKTYTNHSIILRRRKPDAFFTCSLSYFLDGNFSKLKEVYYPPTLNPDWIYGNINGLLLLLDDHKNLVLYNPTTRKLKRLPYSGTDSELKKYGLCYHESDDDYRVVELHQLRDSYKDYIYKDYIWEVKIYSLRTNSWRKIDDDFHCSRGLQVGGFKQTFVSGIPVDGVLYWSISGSWNKIFAVDTTTYTYRTLAGPQYDNTVSSCNFKSTGVMDFGECVGVYRYYSKLQSDIWTMKESWTKVLSVPYYNYPRGDGRPLL